MIRRGGRRSRVVKKGDSNQRKVWRVGNKGKGWGGGDTNHGGERGGVRKQQKRGKGFDQKRKKKMGGVKPGKYQRRKGNYFN